MIWVKLFVHSDYTAQLLPNLFVDGRWAKDDKGRVHYAHYLQVSTDHV